ncbi:hypothetical protein DRJ17_07635, partial [Candidatus Woesearchaeota archaeon]
MTPNEEIRIIAYISREPDDPENKFYIPQLENEEQLLVIRFEVEKGVPSDKKIIAKIDIDRINFCYTTLSGKKQTYSLLEIFNKVYITSKNLYEGTEIEKWYSLNIAENATNPLLIFRGIKPIKDLSKKLLSDLRTQKEKRIIGEIIFPELEIERKEPMIG